MCVCARAWTEVCVILTQIHRRLNLDSKELSSVYNHFMPFSADTREIYYRCFNFPAPWTRIPSARLYRTNLPPAAWIQFRQPLLNWIFNSAPMFVTLCTRAVKKGGNNDDFRNSFRTPSTTFFSLCVDDRKNDVPSRLVYFLKEKKVTRDVATAL